jgi:hypothetical protein
MELLINGQPLALPLDFEIELEEVNPFFSEVGSQSLPITLPYTPHNLEVLGHPERIAHTFKLDTEHEAVLRHGVLQKVGRLVIFSASKESGIETNFYLNDGEFYTIIKDVHMNQLNFAGNPFDPYAGTAAEKAKQWIQHFEKVQRGITTADYAIFPVCTNIDTTEKDEQWRAHELLNEPNPNTRAIPRPLLGYEERTVNDVQFPIGYGITPFLKFNYVLQSLFAHFKYTLLPSLFNTDPDLSKMVLLNNTADAVCSGKLDYRQLVPSCSVTSFINTIRNKFCCDFIPDSRTKTISVKFLQTLSNTLPDMDISPFIVDEPIITHDDFKQLRLIGGTGLEFAQPATETFEDLIHENIYVSSAKEGEFVGYNKFINEVILRLSTGQFYKQIASNNSISLVRIGSSYFNYDKKTENLKYDEREAEDEQPPMLDFHISFYDNEHTEYERLWCPFIGERRHLNTGIKKDGTIAEEKVDENKIIFSFNIGIQTYNNLAMGTQFCYNALGNKWGNLSLQYAGMDGLFVRFWKYYDALLRHAFRKVTCKLNIPVNEFLKFNIHTPKLLNGVIVLPANIRYKIGKKGIIIDEAEFYTLRLLQPYNLDVEQEIPGFNTSEYYWVRFNNVNSIMDAKYSYIGGGFYFHEITSSPPDPRTYPPPTAAEMTAGGKYHIRQYTMDIYWQDSPFGNNPLPDPIKKATENYTAWLEPRKK